jgi:DMSO/TMAO reductase YedYZ molybdopterin-dependent catalytic subunit
MKIIMGLKPVISLFLAAILLAAAMGLSCSQPPPPAGPAADNGTQANPDSDLGTRLPNDDLGYLINADPAKVDNTKLPVTPVDKLHTTGTPVDVDALQYRLTVDGLVDNPLSLGLDEIKSYPAVSETVLLICPYFFVDNAEWTGVPVSVLLNQAGIKPGANKVSFYALDGYGDQLPLSDVMKEGVFLAYKVDGQELPREHGYPLRLVVKSKFGSTWVKWVQKITVS